MSRTSPSSTASRATRFPSSRSPASSRAASSSTRKPGDYLERGERVGLIKFGSRTDILLPGHAEPLVKPGDRVRGGASIVARIATTDPDFLLASIDAELPV
jgi:phosphatidylserine decarboxylase